MINKTPKAKHRSQVHIATRRNTEVRRGNFWKKSAKCIAFRKDLRSEERAQQEIHCDKNCRAHSATRGQRRRMDILGIFQMLHLAIRELGRKYDRVALGLSTRWQHPGMCSLPWAYYMPANAWERSEVETWSGQLRKGLIWGISNTETWGNLDRCSDG